ncbi:hypothetical protein PN462_22215 [Spirulina sp. CS-785/01]|uniref:hypothetical protein n=1 Tax=Spirulina sp. CS-785/01 TaxID=3021716 RepID=UPI00232D6263|nr:hypothetical protein [Spirulina sp. CS-785/01]MDB9315843.1 hypothetical protein [Spirulina sp. CS-785/01]
MNLYFLVEGRSTETKLYPRWLQYLVPELTQVDNHDDVQKNNYYLVSGQGYPAILNYLSTAVEDITEVGVYNYLVICVDADEDSVKERKEEIRTFIEEQNFELGSTKVKIIIQNRCIESWLLGNRKIFDSRQP